MGELSGPQSSRVSCDTSITYVCLSVAQANRKARGPETAPHPSTYLHLQITKSRLHPASVQTRGYTYSQMSHQQSPIRSFCGAPLDRGGLRDLTGMVPSCQLFPRPLLKVEGKKSTSVPIAFSAWSLDPRIIRDQSLSHSAQHMGPGGPCWETPGQLLGVAV